ncbi:hypothetical protein I302_102352 [Kwoniella bestiolae CBS 10118]|uniref:endo-polygalacturonase n=1 Tax=Kwoniella bestiolae CBS 10118 TaxID=1296100 RepID=A0A1B9GET7_9TREE|nr:hypothetical protein I302_01045 [Kwoniella bestiolae CBS 10118]OCF29537.1 hypothetical protein I302_01045 [Kwoniella bestiolae CBS 10118]
MFGYKHLISLLPLLATSSAFVIPSNSGLSRRCVSAISSYDEVDSAVSSGCDIELGAITVPSGKALDLSGLGDGATVTVTGDVTFEGGVEWEGPMFIIDGSDITFNGGGHTFDGQGATYWDGQGSNGGKTKPKMMKLKMGGSFSDLTVLNAPVHVFSVGNKAPLLITGVTIDNKAGFELNEDGDELSHNSDCFDVSATDTTIDGNTCWSTDDCLALNKGQGIVFSNNICQGTHGISIGSIKSDAVVSNVKITGNTVDGADNGLRIKTIAGATRGSVSDVTYSNNKITNALKYGVVIQQDYENGSSTGEPTNGIEISNIVFDTGNTVETASDAKFGVYVLCGDGSCTGNWDWSGLTVSGAENSISGDPPITGFTA